MTYCITGLDPARFAPLFAMDDGALAAHRAVRTFAGEGRYPCRVSLEDARPGEELILLHHTSHAVETPYRSAFAIYVRKGASRAARCVDTLPPVLRGRPIALRCFDRSGNLVTAGLALEDNVDALARAMFDRPDIAYIDAHNAMHGCFAARIERHEA